MVGRSLGKGRRESAGKQAGCGQRLLLPECVGDMRVNLPVFCHLPGNLSWSGVVPCLAGGPPSVVREPELGPPPSSLPGPGDLCHRWSSTGCVLLRSWFITSVWTCPENPKFYYLLSPQCLLSLFVSPNCHCCHLKSSYLHPCLDHAVATNRSLPPFLTCSQFSTQQ